MGKKKVLHVHVADQEEAMARAEEARAVLKEFASSVRHVARVRDAAGFLPLNALLEEEGIPAWPRTVALWATAHGHAEKILLVRVKKEGGETPSLEDVDRALSGRGSWSVYAAPDLGTAYKADTREETLSRARRALQSALATILSLEREDAHAVVAAAREELEKLISLL